MYSFNKSCSALPWAPREITCEANYMEVILNRSKLGIQSFSKRNLVPLQLSVWREVSGPSELQQDWSSAFRPVSFGIIVLENSAYT